MNLRQNERLLLVQALAILVASVVFLVPAGYACLRLFLGCQWDLMAQSTSPDGNATVVVWAQGCATTDTTLHAHVYGPGERLEPGRGVEIFWTDWWEGAYGRCPIDSGIRFAWGTEGGEPCLMIENDVPIYERVPTGSPVQVFYDRYDCP